MPIVTVRTLTPADPQTIPPMLTEIQAAGADALGCGRDNLWVVFDGIPPGRYVQAPDPARNPPIVTIQATAGRTPDQKTALARAVSRAVARGLRVPEERVWIHYQELAPKEIWFNGAWSG